MKLSYTLFDIANTTAKDLLEIGAVSFNPNDPFTFTSGLASPIYIDVRLMIGVPVVRARLISMASSFIYREIGERNFNVIAGGETAGIPIATSLADEMHKPLCYIRKTPKGCGRNAQIEGLTDKQLDEGRKFLLVEDLCSDGGSKKNFIEAIRKSGNIVTNVFVVFSYGIFDAAELLGKDGITLHSMVDAAKLLEVAEDLETFPLELLTQIKDFLALQRGNRSKSLDFFPNLS